MESLIVAVLWLLIYVVIVAALIYGVIYVLGVVGFTLPEKIVKLLWLAFALFVLVLIVQLLLGSGGVHLPGAAVLGFG